MKFAGIILLFVSCVCFAYYTAYQLRMRLKAAEDYTLLISEIKNEMQFTHKTVSEILLKIHSVTRSEHIKQLLDDEYHQNVNQENLKARLKDSKIDCEIADNLLYFFSNLGKSDLDGQRSLCELCKGKMEQQLRVLREETGKKAKLIQSLGILLGIAIAILLF